MHVNINLNDERKAQIAETLKIVAQKAGKILIDNFRTNNITYIQKSGRADMVTNIDIAVQRLIIEELTQYFPKIPIIGEEDKKENIVFNLQQEKLFFLVDPLDGTLNFIHGLPFFGVSIALVKGNRPIVGVVHAPILEETFTAIANCGAFMNGQKLRCSKDLPVSEAIGATGWPYDQSLIAWTQKTLYVMQKNIQEIRILGAAALEMCYVAAGIIDIYWEVGLQPWDLAAGWLTVSEAGGKVSDINGNTFDLFSGQVLACRSKQLWQNVVKMFKNLH
mgnify:CR=1 FL=1